MSYTAPQDLTGLPGLRGAGGLRRSSASRSGVQFTGPPWSEARVLRAAQALFDVTEEIQERRPEGRDTPAGS